MKDAETRGEELCREVLGLQQNPSAFEALALKIFRYQYAYNPVYQSFVHHLKTDVSSVQRLEEIPFLPISFYKTFEIKTGVWPSETFFLTSGTTGKSSRGTHHIRSLSFYHRLATALFEEQFGPVSQFHILALLPHYLENPHSSLISMVRVLGRRSGHEAVFLGLDFEEFGRSLKEARTGGKKVLVFSVSYALMEMARRHPESLEDCLVIETGGMKGFGRDMPKAAMVEHLSDRLKIKDLYSEYGMTEMLSQAYARPMEFEPGFSMRLLVRSMQDPLEVRACGRGLANIIDLGNVFSCSFLATDDLAVLSSSGNFQITGRAGDAELRGCNLLFIS
jgi:hypothetical protein